MYNPLVIVLLIFGATVTVAIAMDHIIKGLVEYQEQKNRKDGHKKWREWGRKDERR